MVALQEVSVEKGFPDVLAGALADRGLPGCTIGRPPIGSRKRYGNAVASRWEAHSPDVGPGADDGSRHWRPLVFSALVTPASGGDVLVFSVHVPNGSGNGWAKIDAFEALAAAVAGRTTPTCVVAGDFNEPFRFDDGSPVSFAYQHGEQPDERWPVGAGTTRPRGRTRAASGRTRSDASSTATPASGCGGSRRRTAPTNGLRT